MPANQVTDEAQIEFRFQLAIEVVLRHKIVQREGLIGYRLTKVVAQRRREVENKIEQLIFKDVNAKLAGFDRPILHGLCTYGFTGRALLHSLCGGDPARFRSMEGRFSAPVFPGETIRTEVWRDGTAMSFRARVNERDVIAINHGRSEVKA